MHCNAAKTITTLASSAPYGNIYDNFTQRYTIQSVFTRVFSLFGVIDTPNKQDFEIIFDFAFIK